MKPTADIELIIYIRVDPDYPNRKSVLDDPFLDVKEGDVITKVNGRDALSSIDIGELIRNEANKQVKLTIKRDNKSKDILLVKPQSNEFG